ncbi:Protein kinase C-binding protein NELL1 [Eumeta japonica]|uniref:Protein kinase C-binding protein NELL1 n=1 Tax=Eumeta variegata TaxID=151549 RepID=A0A4C1T0M0_EUMVA|nr:Protein kinase C-binding protein NELL1 [Eumeta japonica]
MKKLCWRWILHNLTEVQKTDRVTWCNAMLTRFKEGVSNSVRGIVTGDKTWIYYYGPKIKHQSTLWVYRDEPKRIKVARERSVSKQTIASFFFNKIGHVAIVVLENCRTMNSDWYTTICLPEVIDELRKSNRKSCSILQRDNASSHTAKGTNKFLEEKNVELISNPAYSPNLAPCESRSLQVEGSTFARAAELLRRSPEFTLLAALKQEPANSGTILSFSHGYNSNCIGLYKLNTNKVTVTMSAGAARRPRCGVISLERRVMLQARRRREGARAGGRPGESRSQYRLSAGAAPRGRRPPGAASAARTRSPSTAARAHRGISCILECLVPRNVLLDLPVNLVNARCHPSLCMAVYVCRPRRARPLACVPAPSAAVRVPYVSCRVVLHPAPPHPRRRSAGLFRARVRMHPRPHPRRAPAGRTRRALEGTPPVLATFAFQATWFPYLEVQSSGRRDEVRLHYVAAGGDGGGARIETFPFRLADGAWHRLALAVSGAQATLLVDCHPLYRRLIPPPDRNFTQPQLTLWIGQRNSKHSLFKGTLQEVRLVSGPHGYLAQCPGLDSECPTCGQFALLQATVQELTGHLHDLSLKLVGAEARLARLEQCDCQKSCFSNGTVHADGATWQRDCNRCSCVHGEITCRPVECDRADCKNPVLHPGECCPTCLTLSNLSAISFALSSRFPIRKPRLSGLPSLRPLHLSLGQQCLLKGTLYEHGDRFTPKECAECVCHDGNMQCTRVDPDAACPPLPCDPPDQFSVPGECCKFCPGVDYCSKGHSCDENATCMNLNTKYTCKCNQGFQGDGLTCEGRDGRQHPPVHQRSVVYVCQCLPGYARRDKYNCIEVDECASSSHTCHAAAECTNTPGSYTCQCRDGYSGDGYVCTPVCTGGCLNGGECAAPETCACPAGFGGVRCERDVDECAAPVHPAASSPCPPRALCVNAPGSYYCVCRQGFRRANQDHCEDIDECEDGSHTCHPSAVCRNIDGGFRCECETQPCELSCSWRGAIMSDGARWPEANGCQRCSCTAGVVSCSRTPCACDAPSNVTDSSLAAVGAETAPTACCAHCDPRYHCRHQEMHHVTFRSGDRWLYQCQICECLLGEVDCWEPHCEESSEAAGACCVGLPEGEGWRASPADLAGCAPAHCSDCQPSNSRQLMSEAVMPAMYRRALTRLRAVNDQTRGFRALGSVCCSRRRDVTAALALLALWWARPAVHRKHRGARPI